MLSVFLGGVYSHGFVNAADGRKMSKSYDNTIDPIEVSKSVLLDLTVLKSLLKFIFP